MQTLRRLGRYLLPLWRDILQGVAFMTLYALLGGFSIGLILPIIDKVFMNPNPDPGADPLPVGRGLAEGWEGDRRGMANHAGVLGQVRSGQGRRSRRAFPYPKRGGPARYFSLALCGDSGRDLAQKSRRVWAQDGVYPR